MYLPGFCPGQRKPWIIPLLSGRLLRYPDLHPDAIRPLRKSIVFFEICNPDKEKQYVCITKCKIYFSLTAHDRASRHNDTLQENAIMKTPG
jgi:hypothetical protein